MASVSPRLLSLGMFMLIVAVLCMHHCSARKVLLLDDLNKHGMTPDVRSANGQVDQNEAEHEVIPSPPLTPSITESPDVRSTNGQVDQNEPDPGFIPAPPLGIPCLSPFPGLCEQGADTDGAKQVVVGEPLPPIKENSAEQTWKTTGDAPVPDSYTYVDTNSELHL